MGSFGGIRYIAGEGSTKDVCYGDPPKQVPISFEIVFNLTGKKRSGVRRPFLTRHSMSDVVKHKVGYGTVYDEIESRFRDCTDICPVRTYTVVIRREDISSKLKKKKVKDLMDSIRKFADENNIICMIVHETAMSRM